MRRGEHPGHSGVGEGHGAVPAFHGYDCQVGFHAAFEQTLAVEVAGEFAGGQSVDVGDWILADKGEIALFGDAAFHLVSAERVRAVEHHEFLPVLGCGFHSEPHSGDEGVAAGADVLDVIDEHIYVLKHLRGWLFGFTVERVDGHSGFRIGVIGHVGSGHMVTSDAVFGGEESSQPDVVGFGKDVDCRFERIVNACRVCDEAHSHSVEFLEAVAAEHLDAWQHRGAFRFVAGDCRGGSSGCV